MTTKSLKSKTTKRRRSWTRNVTMKKRMTKKRKRSETKSLMRSRQNQTLSHA